MTPPRVSLQQFKFSRPMRHHLSQFKIRLAIACVSVCLLVSSYTCKLCFILNFLLIIYHANICYSLYFMYFTLLNWLLSKRRDFLGSGTQTARQARPLPPPIDFGHPPIIGFLDVSEDFRQFFLHRKIFIFFL